MAKRSKIEPVNIDLYEKAWGHRRNLKKLKNNRAVKRKAVADEKQRGKGRAFCSAPGKT
jgi:hypothetical protein